MYNKTVCIDENVDSYMKGIPMPTEIAEESIPQIIEQIISLAYECRGNANDIERTLIGPAPQSECGNEREIVCLMDAVKKARSILSDTRITLESVKRRL